MSSIPEGRPHGPYADRPAPCRHCNLPAWWNGWRTVSSVERTLDGVERKTDIARHRVRCSSPACPAKDWTVYEDGAYPHRSFQLDVVADAIAELEVETEPESVARSMTAVAAAHHCSRDSVRRWRQWIATFAEPRYLQQLGARMDPDAVVVALRGASAAAAVLGHLERLVHLLLQRGVALPRGASGLTRLLRHQLERFGDVFYLTQILSPPLRADASAAGR